MIEKDKLRTNMLLHYYSEYSSNFIEIRIQSLELTTNGGIRVVDADTGKYLGDAQTNHLHKWNTPIQQVKLYIGSR